MAHIQQPFTWPNLPDSGRRGDHLRQVRHASPSWSRRRRRARCSTPPRPSATTTPPTCSSSRARNSYELYIQPDPVIGLDIGHFHPPLTHRAAAGRAVDRLRHARPISTASTSPTTCWGRPRVDRRVRPIRARARRSRSSPRSRPSRRWGWSRRSTASSRRRSSARCATDAASPAEAQAQALARATRVEPRDHGRNGEVDGLKYCAPAAGRPAGAGARRRAASTAGSTTSSRSPTASRATTTRRASRPGATPSG